jgi:tetratricopeptide (TPR) repeat protein
VVTPEEWVSRIERGERVPSVRTTAEQMREIDALLARGRKDLALDRLQESYAPDSAFHNDRLAFLLEDMGDPRTAREYWRLNMGLEELDRSSRGRAAVGVLETSVALNDHDAVVAAVDDLGAYRSAQAEEALIEAGLLLVDSGDHAAAIAVLEGVLRAYPGSRRAGEVYYHLGLAFESPSARRDVSEAWRMYEIVHTSYPESLYAGEAELRARYLERHFLEIR